MSGKIYSSIELLEKLISYPTVSSASNMELISFIQDYLKSWGIEATLFQNTEKTKANLFATVGPKDKYGIILSGHTDVVPIEGQNWTKDPFRMSEDDNKLFGRGTSDMKGFIAISLSLIPEIISRGLKEPIHFAFSYDEETGCTGCKSMIDYVSTLKVKPRACIVGEPTSLKVVNSHKGIRSYWVTIKGKAAHSSAPDDGSNAIMAAADLIGFIKTEAKNSKNFPSNDERFIPPYTTFNVGEIKGGNAINIIAEHTQFGFEFRPVPGFDSDAVVERFTSYAKNTVLKEMRASASESIIDIHEISNVPPLLKEGDGDLESFIMRLTKTNDVEAVAYATEAGLFQQTAEIPTIVCGPGSITQAHKPDEFIEISQIQEAEKFFGRLLDVVCKT